MKTSVKMKRELFGHIIKQDSKNEFLSASDLCKAGNGWRRQNKLSDFNLSQFLKTNQTKEFIKELESNLEKDILLIGRGKNSQTWVHPFLFIDIAMAISPKLKIQIYNWIYDSLIEYRNKSGDNYYKVYGVIYNRIDNKVDTSKKIKEVANKIREAIGVKDWQTATEKQLETRYKIHENISILGEISKDIDLITETAIKKALEELKNNQ